LAFQSFVVRHLSHSWSLAMSVVPSRAETQNQDAMTRAPPKFRLPGELWRP
jgi:hypothetical protein